MDTTEYTQMNVRMPMALKREGDAAWQSIGFTPTEAVRVLWGKAAERGKALGALQSLMSGEEEPARPEDALAGIRRGRALIEEGIGAIGVGGAALAKASAVGDAAALDAAREELALGKRWL